MARRMGTSCAHLDRLLDPDNDEVPLDTVQRAAAVVGASSASSWRDARCLIAFLASALPSSAAARNRLSGLVHYGRLFQLGAEQGSSPVVVAVKMQIGSPDIDEGSRKR